jgi:2,3-bisphosphoglycerate-independent phosphoglycerate mutase
VSPRPVVLIILDGFGLGKQDGANAIFSAHTPVLDRLFRECPNTVLSSSGAAVGLPDGQIGNSEVGHTNIGAGRVVFQELPRISNAIADGSFFGNPQYRLAMESAKSKNSSLHLIGLLSDGGVHSHITHLYALLEMALQYGLESVYIHAILDGRDVLPKSGAGFVSDCLEKCRELGVGKIATVMGRFYAMDRDKRWDRLEKAYSCLVSGIGTHNDDPLASVYDSYDLAITDEFMEPVICDKDGTIKSGDSVIFYNFRPDRAREITDALTQVEFNAFDRQHIPSPLHFVCTTEYDKSFGLPVAFPFDDLKVTFGEYISSLGLKQLRIAETEKYAHVTFFFNGGRENNFPGEDRVLIPSPRQVPTYDLIPEMSAYPVTEEAIARILSGLYDVVIMNYANCDMVGHTGVMSAAIEAVETVDLCIDRVVDAAHKMGGVCLITADHGNADMMMNEDGSPYTAHTTNPVPLIISGLDQDFRLVPGKLSDITPTILDIMGLSKPPEMSGESLIIR